ncbi:hypothetical protein H4Q26_013131 [Puccinia striiformis f. sp. tritici PST-130]|nr:hypothetical protein H4Q26_013131 [Puccinia striiformis f. sp. tritici PST-130]
MIPLTAGHVRLTKLVSRYLDSLTAEENMVLHSAFFTSIFLSGILYLTIFSVGNASPIVNSDALGERSTLAPRAATEAKESTLFTPRNQITPGSVNKYSSRGAVNSSMRRKNLLKINQQKLEDSLPDVIPKDPNGFFHPASLNRFKSSVASFKAWQHLNFLPDATALARTKAQDVASKVDNFIDKIAIERHPHDRRLGKSAFRYSDSSTDTVK